MRHIALPALLVAAGLCHANGINPPETGKTVVLSAKCEDRSSSTVTVAYRVMFRSGSETDVPLSIKTAAGEVVEVEIDGIRNLALPTGKAAKDGFTAATVEVEAPEIKGKAGLKLGKGSKAVSLSGFTEAGKRVTIALASCKTLQIVSRDAPPALQRREEKKS